MVNEVVQGPVALQGRGYTFRPSGNYQFGEFERLSNLELTPEASIRMRNPQVFATYVSDLLYDWSNARKFVGQYGPYPIASGASFLSMVVDDKIYASSTILTNLNIVVSSFYEPLFQSSIQVEAFWTYNNYNYALIQVIGRGGPAPFFVSLGVVSWPSTFDLDRDPTNLEILEPDNINTDGVFTEILQVPVEPGGWPLFNRWPTMFVKNQLISGERAWVAVEDTVYFSKATDPSVWTVPDGGFFKFPNQEIKDIIALDGSIYVFCDSSVYVIRYSTDPNTDSVVDLVSNQIGVDGVTILGDTFYFVKENALYALSGGNITKQIDLNIHAQTSRNDVGPADNLYAGAGFDVKIIGSDNKLYLFLRSILRGFVTQFTVEGSTYNVPYRGDHAIYQRPFLDISQSPYGFPVVIDLDTGSFNTIDLRESVAKASSHTYTDIDLVPVDAFLVSSEDKTNSLGLYFLWRHEHIPTEETVDLYSRVSSINQVQDKAPLHVDVIPSNISPGFVSTSIEVFPAISFIVKDFTPDNLRYFVKKWRSLMLEADLPHALLDTLPKLGVYVGNITDGYDRVIPTFDSAFKAFDLKELDGELNDQNTYRFGLNQRSKKLTLVLYCPASLPEKNAGVLTYDSRFELRDIRLLWSYTSRAPVGNSNDRS